jgi:hypothetical protein
MSRSARRELRHKAGIVQRDAAVNNAKRENQGAQETTGLTSELVPVYVPERNSYGGFLAEPETVLIEDLLDSMPDPVDTEY